VEAGLNQSAEFSIIYQGVGKSYNSVYEKINFVENIDKRMLTIYEQGVIIMSRKEFRKTFS